MHDPVGVRCGQRVGHLTADIEDGVQGQRALSGEIGQRPARHVFHRDEAERGAVAFDLVDLVDDRDIGMCERRAGPRLREQPARRLLRVARRAHDFQCDRATETLVLGTVHVAHGPGTKVRDQAIPRQCLADHRLIMRRGPSWRT